MYQLLQEAGHIQCLHLMYAEVAWELVYSGTQAQLQMIINPDYLPIFPFLMTMQVPSNTKTVEAKSSLNIFLFLV